MAGASTTTNKIIRRVKEEVHDLRLMKGELMNTKNEMMRDYDAKCRRVYELEAELKELKLNFRALGEWCQVAEPARDAKEQELADLTGKGPSLEAAMKEKEKDLKRALLRRVESECLIGLMRRGGHLYSNLVKDHSHANPILSLDGVGCESAHSESGTDFQKTTRTINWM